MLHLVGGDAVASREELDEDNAGDKSADVGPDTAVRPANDSTATSVTPVIDRRELALPCCGARFMVAPR